MQVQVTTKLPVEPEQLDEFFYEKPRKSQKQPSEQFRRRSFLFA